MRRDHVLGFDPGNLRVQHLHQQMQPLPLK